MFVICVRNKTIFKLTPLLYTHMDSYMFSKVHPRAWCPQICKVTGFPYNICDTEDVEVKIADHILNPDGIYRSIKHQPFFRGGCILHQLPHVASKDPISPLMCVFVEVPV